PGLHRRDPFGTELTQRLEWFALGKRQAPNGAAVTAGSELGRVPAGERDGDEVSVPLAGVGGITILGPRSREAARALVLTFLAEHGQDDARAIVVGELFPSTSTFPGLGRARELSSVWSGLQAEAARRRSLFATAGVSDIAAYRASRPDEPLPLVVVAACDLVPADAGRLAELIESGPELGLHAILADTPVDGLATVRLQGDGHVASTSPDGRMADLVGARIFGVERDPAGELLEVLASARVDPDNDAATQPADEPFRAVPAESALITVHLLGSYKIEADGREVRAGLRAKARELLAFYLLHPEGATLEEATEALWPEADPRRGSEWFWTALGNLRSRLRAATENSELKVIEREGDRYRTEPLFDVDLWRFEAALAAASTQSGDPGLSESLEAAADLYSGELLAGTDWPWAEVPREDLRGRAVDVLVSLGATRMVGGDLTTALSALERAVEIDPLAEQLYRRIMRLHAKLSRPDQADATYRALQARLGEHDLEPSAESAKLHQELLSTS
ncbi:MAG: AfsR/SARP family transcriptional regulator, partial [Acidimicrobiales bacterium]